MNSPRVVTRNEWLTARKAFLDKEKEFTHMRDAVNKARRELPMVQIDKNYTFENANGKATLLDLFEKRRQLIVYHFMWLWDEGVGCPSCSLHIDSAPNLAHFHARNTTFAVVSRGKWDDISAYRKRMGWTMPWYSSFGSDFNYDFHVTIDEKVAPVEYNYKTAAELIRMDESWRGWSGEQPGTSVFLRDGDKVFHTYSSYARGGDLLINTYNYLDLTPLGRQEDWEEPKGRSESVRGNRPDFAS